MSTPPPYGDQPQQPFDPRFTQQMPPPPGYQPPPGYGPPMPPQPPGRGPRKRHTARTVILSIFGVIVLIIVIASVASSGGGSKLDHSISGSNASIEATQSTGTFTITNTPAAAPDPTPTKAVPQTLTYVVTGTPGADVTYGPSGSDTQGQVPMHVTQPLGTPEYYAINAQLQGGGAVTCEILVDGKVLAHSVATGGYNIADCEISQNILTGKWESDN